MSGPRIPRLTPLALLGLSTVLVALALAACDGGDNNGDTASPTPEPPRPRVVRSDDGLLTLSIPPGAVEDEVDVSVSAVPADELPSALSELAGAGGGYRLEPDGLELSRPATATLELDRDALVGQPGSGSAAWALISLTPDGERQALDNLQTRARLGDRSVFVSGRLNHFSLLGRTRGSLAVSIEAVRPAPSVGEPFPVLMSALNADSTGRVALRGLFGQFTSVEPLAFERIAEGPEPAGDLPENAFALPFGSEVGFEDGVVATGEFTCEAAGMGSYGVEVFATSEVEVRGEPTVTGLTVILDSLVTCE